MQFSRYTSFKYVFWYLIKSIAKLLQLSYLVCKKLQMKTKHNPQSQFADLCRYITLNICELSSAFGIYYVNHSLYNIIL